MSERSERPARPRATSTAPLERLLAAKEIVVTCGAGGVGKTTTAAALGAMTAAHLGGKALVLTVDPARRLANALGLEQFGNVERLVPRAAFEAAGAKPKGELWAAMLDTRQSWDDLVRRHAPNPATRDAILTNPLYENITGRFVQSHDYIAMERLFELHQSSRYDVVIVDTPPSRNALDFLDAPARMAEFFGGRLLRWLTVPYRSRLFTTVSKPFYQVADRVLGTQFLQDIAEFFILFQTMEAGFVQRAKAVSRVLADRRTTFVLVSTLEAAPVREAEFFVEALAARRLALGAIVLNKVLPSSLLDGEAARAARELNAGAVDLAERFGDLAPAESVARVLTQAAASFEDLRLAASREAEQRAELGTAGAATVAVPWLEDDVHDLAGLLRLGAWLWNEGDPASGR